MARDRRRKFCVYYTDSVFRSVVKTIHVFAYNKTDAANYIMENGVEYRACGHVKPSKITKVKRMPQVRYFMSQAKAKKVA